MKRFDDLVPIAIGRKWKQRHNSSTLLRPNGLSHPSHFGRGAGGEVPTPLTLGEGPGVRFPPLTSGEARPDDRSDGGRG